LKIILSPAKKMKVHADTPLPLTEPLFPDRTREVLSYMRSLTYEEAKKLWACNDRIAREAWDALERMDPGGSSLLTPAVLAYEGIAYQYMAPAVFAVMCRTFSPAYNRARLWFLPTLVPVRIVPPIFRVPG
jgi:cytoplasmic iron level regulating protein YaaA (DUF328/UPF0246 family)